MYVPIIKDIDTALRIYYSYTELDTKLIKELFPDIKAGTMSKLRSKVKDLMAERGVRTFGRHHINTKIAFEVFGIDPSDLEERKEKLLRLGLGSEAKKGRSNT